VGRFDALTPLIDWVENGNGPEQIIASGSSFPGRTRPLCRYSAYASYNGTGRPAGRRELHLHGTQDALIRAGSRQTIREPGLFTPRMPERPARSSAVRR
jgi:hypothetical protein